VKKKGFYRHRGACANLFVVSGSAAGTRHFSTFFLVVFAAAWSGTDTNLAWHQIAIAFAVVA
jgi:hypothetical protein